MKRLLVALIALTACASLPRPSDSSPPEPQNSADEATVDNCRRMDDHGVACAIGLAIDHAINQRK